MEEIIAQIERKTKVSFGQILSKNRKKHIAQARHELCHELRFKGKMTTIAIAKLLNRNHSTVVHSCRQFDCLF